MKKQLLRLSVLSMLCMLFGSTAWAGANDLLWDYTQNAPGNSPDNGLYFGGKITDAGRTGVKLNGSGYAYFAKPAVAGKLTLVFGLRSGTGAYSVNVYTCDNAGTKGTLIGEVSVAESLGKGSIEVGADVTGIRIERKTNSEGTIQKIEFKETKARTFVDFEMKMANMKEEYDVSTLPQGVSFSGTFNTDQHGYRAATITVPVDGTVKFTFGDCQYGNKSFSVLNQEEKDIATLSYKGAGCWNDNDASRSNVFTYIYVGGPDVLTFKNIQYLNYFKAEATEVQEATITYKDQNGNKLGEKKVFEGDPVGEIPYSEADLTIPEGYKFRGWVYASGVKSKPTDIVNGDVSINASVTAIEQAPTVGSIQIYDLRPQTFYPEDHELFSVNGAVWHDSKHGFVFNANQSFTVDVTGKAQIVLNICNEGAGATITVTDENNNVIKSDISAKSSTDGAVTSVNYEGPATKLTFTYSATGYLHKVTVLNVSEFPKKDETSGYYIVPANDGPSLILALNAAASEADSKIFLPNGTYDFGEATLTGISGTNVSLIGQSMENVIIKNAPPVSMEGLEKADLFLNTGTGLYMQDLTLQNALDYYSAGSAGRAPTLHDKGTKTINKNVRHLSYQDTYYSHSVGGLYYFEGGEMHGTVDYLCGNGKAYFNKMKIINEKRSSATISANSELYVFNECVVENNADAYNFGRAWNDTPTCIFLNTTLMDNGAKLIATRWEPKGINVDFKIAGEFGTKNAAGENITPASNIVTFQKASTTLETILTAEQAATYTIESVLGSWAATAQQQAAQLEAPAATYADGNVTWTPANNGATAYLIEKNGAFAGITAGSSFAITIDAEKDNLTIRAANSRGGFGEAKQVKGTATGIHAVKAAIERGEKVIYNLAGQRVDAAYKGLVIRDGVKIMQK